MKKSPSLLLILLSGALVVACNKKAPESALAQSSEVASVNAAVVTPATSVKETPEQSEIAQKRSLMDYAIMEEKFLTDTRGQWATNAKASSVFGDANKTEAGKLEVASKATKAPDTQTWTNNNIELGFDWLELTYEKPMQATEVRVALENGKGAEALSKIELQEENGNWNVVWSDISDVKVDARGKRTWFVKGFEKTKYKTKAVKITFANNLEHHYKEVDAVQLIGD